MPQDKIKVEFAPGAFDDWDGSQEELDAMVAEIERMAESGELQALSTDLDQADWDLLPEEQKARIVRALEDPNASRTRH